MNQTKWTRNNLFGTLDAVISHLDEWGASGVMVQREDLETWRDENEQLREVCTELMEHYMDNSDCGSQCIHCGAEWLKSGVKHRVGCPIILARKILNKD